ncbi:hypothetical protein Pla163_37510 [Planctomycetes bacterium Pla163]|jgi:hypothetical protein|uniref:MmcQ/YjbR family DNA-binding protein n=1 Tax=Rohdeia mirabilis TaxID=2528008 RepID=A0A518D545_9BACT|nr:hypothetical protein Pla163_37510 [Planctomycetes bacterium Pla163]
MNAAQFRRLALALPEVVEHEHHDHPDFRVGGKVFATLGPDGSWAMVKLPPDAQADLIDRDPEAYEPMPGAWGRQGCTRVSLTAAQRTDVEPALALAWHTRATPAIRKKHGGGR